MENLKYITVSTKIQFAAGLAVFLFSSVSHVSLLDVPNTDLQNAISHQKELVGNNRLPQSSVSDAKIGQAISHIVLNAVQKGLPQKFKKDSEKIATAIIEEAEKYKMDPLFVLSVIHHESRFNPLAIGTVKEVGLMQIRPETAKWLNDKHKIVKKLNLKNPVTNIKIGTFFLSTLRDNFDGHSRYYISAYNMGAGNVRKNLRQNKKPKEYVLLVMKHYVEYLEKVQTSTVTASQDSGFDFVEMPLPATEPIAQN